MLTAGEADTVIVWRVRILELPSAIPAIKSDHSLLSPNSHTTLNETCRFAVDRNPDIAAEYLSHISELPCIDQSDMLLVTRHLLESLATPNHPNAAQIEQSLLLFLSRHTNSLEGLNIISQVTRLWSESFAQATQIRSDCVEKSREKLRSSFQGLACSVSDSYRAYNTVLTRAFESALLREAASVAIAENLRQGDPTYAPQRKMLAESVLQVLRHVSDYLELRRLASIVFTSGGTHSSCTSSFELAESRDRARSPTPAFSQSLCLEKLSGTDGYRNAERLTPNDFEQLRQLKGLSLEAFKEITERIRLRATSESWARAAILDLARAPHAPEVTTSIRTAALGALVSEARRLGRLTPQIEKEIFAVSAEIPTLVHLKATEPTDPPRHLS